MAQMSEHCPAKFTGLTCQLDDTREAHRAGHQAEISGSMYTWGTTDFDHERWGVPGPAQVGPLVSQEPPYLRPVTMTVAEEPEMTDKIEHGTWIKVWAQVVSDDEVVQVHPEDIAVRIQSHSEDQYMAVRKEGGWIAEVPDTPPPWAPRCTSMFVNPAEGSEVYRRCTRTDDHAGAHAHSGLRWEDRQEAGNIED